MSVFFQKYLLFFLVFEFASCLEDFYKSDGDRDSDELIQKMYYKYKEIIGDSETIAPIVNVRRFFDRGNAFEIHVKKLKEVNGYKRHNLMIKGRLREGDGNELVYINNPVESKLPNSFVTLKEFKEMLLERAKQNSIPFPGKDKINFTHSSKVVNNVFTTKKVLPTRTVYRNYTTLKRTKHEKVNDKTSTINSGKEKQKKLSFSKAAKIYKMNSSSLTISTIVMKSLKSATHVNKINFGNLSTAFSKKPKEKSTKALIKEIDRITEFTTIEVYSNKNSKTHNDSNLDSKDHKSTKQITNNDHVSGYDKKRNDLVINAISINDITSIGKGQKQSTKELLATTTNETAVDLDKTTLELKENETLNTTKTTKEKITAKLNEIIIDLNETTVDLNNATVDLNKATEDLNETAVDLIDLNKTIVDSQESDESSESADLGKYLGSSEQSEETTTVATRRTNGRPMVFME